MKTHSYHRYYRVGGHVFLLDMPETIIEDNALSSYVPFLAVPEDEKLLFTLVVTEDEKALPVAIKQITRFDDGSGTIQIFRAASKGLIFHLSFLDNPVCCRFYVDYEYKQATACLGGTAEERLYGLNNCLMMLYAFASSRYDTLLMHASVIENNGRGYLFIGKSGTGKSTHSRLWLEHIEGSRLLNDDNPVLRLEEGCAVVYGSPWSGKTACFRNRSVPVGSIVRLWQAPYNNIWRLPLNFAYAAILPACSSMRWESIMARDIHHTIEKLISRTSVFSLLCLPEAEAARICAETICKEKE